MCRPFDFRKLFVRFERKHGTLNYVLVIDTIIVVMLLVNSMDVTTAIEVPLKSQK